MSTYRYAPLPPASYGAVIQPPQSGLPGWVKVAGLGLLIFLFVRGCEPPQPGPNPNPGPGNFDPVVVEAGEIALRELGVSYAEFFRTAQKGVESGDIDTPQKLDDYFVKNSLDALEKGTGAAMKTLTDKLPTTKFESDNKAKAANALGSIAEGFDQAQRKIQ